MGRSGAQSAVWYIDAMISKGLAIIAVLLAAAQPSAATAGQAGGSSHASPQHPTASVSSPATPAAASAAAAPPATGNSTNVNTAAQSNCFGGTCDYQPSHITIATPAPAPAPWPLPQRIAWAANLVLVILGYVGILLAISTLRKIERQTRYGEAAATAAAESAQAALLHAQAIVRAERPWILVTVEPSRSTQNGFSVMVTNRGHSPARIESATDAIAISVDETQLPAVPAYGNAEPNAPAGSMILLPGESTAIRSFCRNDVKGICETGERLKRVEDWEEKIFLYGKVAYRDLMAPGEEQPYETSWCCWYIHGRQKSGMVMAGPPAYNQHN
jgi:hypothetical protein